MSHAYFFVNRHISLWASAGLSKLFDSLMLRSPLSAVKTTHIDQTNQPASGGPQHQEVIWSTPRFLSAMIYLNTVFKVAEGVLLSFFFCMQDFNSFSEKQLVMSMKIIIIITIIVIIVVVVVVVGSGLVIVEI